MLDELHRQNEQYKEVRARLWSRKIPITGDTEAKTVEIVRPISQKITVLQSIVGALEQKIKTLDARIDRAERSVFGTQIREPELKSIRVGVREIARMTSRYFKVSYMEVMGTRRAVSLVKARHVSFYIAKKVTGNSLPFIGYHMGGRDHTTVLHGVRKIEARLVTSPDLAEDINSIIESLSQSVASASTQSETTDAPIEGRPSVPAQD